MQVTYTIQGDVNTSVQVGDNIYFCLKSPDASYQTSNSFVHSGVVSGIEKVGGNTNIIVTATNISNVPGGNNFQFTNMNDYFLFFAKDTSANLNRIKGYYASVLFRNDSNEHAELYTVGAEIQKSSK
tara:strand:+ start:149 stop:529 length:381 start_codon:yes stop_codon:yes gene_type:complete